MFTLEEIENMSLKEFTKNWNNGKIQEATLVLLGADKAFEQGHKPESIDEKS